MGVKASPIFAVSDDAIVSFSGENAFLSNFAPCQIIVNGVMYPTAEHFYQAMKTADVELRAHIARIPSPGAAKRFSRTIAVRDSWKDLRYKVMTYAVDAKFAVGSDYAERLLATGSRQLVEGNHWKDKFWGACYVGDDRYQGHNHLGQLLMQKRDTLRG